MSIYSRILLPYVLSLAIGSVVAWWLATGFIAAALHSRLEDGLQRAVAHLAQGRLPIAPDLVARLGALIGGDLTLIPRGPDPAPALATADLPPPVAAALREPPGDGRHRVRVGDVPYSVVVQPLSPALDARYAALAASAPLTEIDAASRRIAVLLGALALGGTLILAWIAHLGARDITGPLQRLAAVAGRIATGDLNARSDRRGPAELRALAGALDDMAERLAAYQAEAARRNRLSALGELSARMAHEIRNPLTAIRLHVQLLGEALDETRGATPGETQADRGQRRTIAGLLKEIDRLELVVATSLGLARPAGAGLVEADLGALVREVAALVGPQLAHRRIDLILAGGPVPTARLDADGIRQVLFNLVNNAADELEAGGIIRISTGLEPAIEPGRGALTLAVEDSGPGIAPERAADLFQRGESRKPHGLGLGLTISREICEGLGGSLRVETSRDLGGALFLVRLPLAPPPRDPGGPP